MQKALKIITAGVAAKLIVPLPLLCLLFYTTGGSLTAMRNTITDA